MIEQDSAGSRQDARGGIASGARTDRNKTGLLLIRTTESKGQEITHSLRSAAMEPLIAQASWADVPGRSAAVLVSYMIRYGCI
jgi:hypothetical protein